jgi:hypothetical protein
MYCKEFRDAWSNGKLPEASEKLRSIYALIDELKTYGIMITLKEEIKSQ